MKKYWASTGELYVQRIGFGSQSCVQAVASRVFPQNRLGTIPSITIGAPG